MILLPLIGGILLQATLGRSSDLLDTGNLLSLLQSPKNDWRLPSIIPSIWNDPERTGRKHRNFFPSPLTTWRDRFFRRNPHLPFFGPNIFNRANQFRRNPYLPFFGPNIFNWPRQIRRNPYLNWPRQIRRNPYLNWPNRIFRRERISKICDLKEPIDALKERITELLHQKESIRDIVESTVEEVLKDNVKEIVEETLLELKEEGGLISAGKGNNDENRHKDYSFREEKCKLACEELHFEDSQREVEECELKCKDKSFDPFNQEGKVDKTNDDDDVTDINIEFPDIFEPSIDMPTDDGVEYPIGVDPYYPDEVLTPNADVTGVEDSDSEKETTDDPWDEFYVYEDIPGKSGLIEEDNDSESDVIRPVPPSVAVGENEETNTGTGQSWEIKPKVAAEPDVKKEKGSEDAEFVEEHDLLAWEAPPFN